MSDRYDFEIAVTAPELCKNNQRFVVWSASDNMHSALLILIAETRYNGT